MNLLPVFSPSCKFRQFFRGFTRAPSGRVRRAPHRAAGCGEPGTNLGHEVLGCAVSRRATFVGPALHRFELAVVLARRGLPWLFHSCMGHVRLSRIGGLLLWLYRHLAGGSRGIGIGHGTHRSNGRAGSMISVLEGACRAPPELDDATSVTEPAFARASQTWHPAPAHAVVPAPPSAHQQRHRALPRARTPVSSQIDRICTEHPHGTGLAIRRMQSTPQARRSA
jgi:hypothetical protein